MRENTRPGLRRQIFEQGVFLAGQLDFFAGAFHILREPVNFQVGHPQNAGTVHRAAAQQCFHAQQQLGKGKRLGQVIIRAGFKILYLV